MRVKDIIAEAKSSRGYGGCSDPEILAALSDAVRLLANKSAWDAYMGFMSVCAPDGYLALPREVEKVMGATINGSAAWPRDRWFIHHINGPGANSCIDGFNKFFDEVGTTPIFRCVRTPSVLFAIPESANDNGKEMLVYGYDINDAELFHVEDGEAVKGMRVPINTSGSTSYPDAAIVKKITHVFKPETEGIVRLWGYEDNFGPDTEPDLYGYYYPDEKEPRYRQYRFPKSALVDITYRRKNLEFRSQEDWIPFDNRLAILQALKAVREYGQGQTAKGESYEDTATRLLLEEEKAIKQQTTIGPQIRNFSAFKNESLRGGRCGYRGRR